MTIANNKFLGTGTIAYSDSTDINSAISNGAYVDGNLPVSMNKLKSAESTYTSGTSLDLNGYQVIRLNASATQSLNTITNGYYGDVITLYASNGNTTLVHGTSSNNLCLKGALNTTLSTDQQITFKYFNYKWYEIGRNF
jgi:hypothetical protein